MTDEELSLAAKLDNEREAHAKTRAELYDLRAEYMANLNHWEEERAKLVKQIEDDRYVEQRIRCELGRTIARHELALADLQRRYDARKADRNDAERALFRVGFEVTGRDSMPADFDEIVRLVIQHVERLRLRLLVKRATLLYWRIVERGNGRDVEWWHQRWHRRADRVLRIYTAARKMGAPR